MLFIIKIRVLVKSLNIEFEFVCIKMRSNVELEENKLDRKLIK